MSSRAPGGLIRRALAILLLASSVLMLLLVGFILYPLVIVVATVIHVLGAVKANNGEWWTPPMTPQLVK